MTTAFLLAMVVAHPLGCGSSDGPEGAESTRTSASPILNGTKDDTSPYRFPYVGALHMGDASSYSRCGGTLLSCGVAVTAAHCFDSESASGALNLNHEAPVSEPDLGYPVVGSVWFNGPVGTVSPRDLALVSISYGSNRMAKSAAAAAVYPRIGQPDELTEAGIVAAVGYGYANTNCTDGKFRRYGDVVVGSIGPLITVNELTPGVMATSTDSGSPILGIFDDTGTRPIFGVLSGGNHDYEQCNDTEGYYVNITGTEKRDWISSTMAQLDRDEDGDGIPYACDLCPTSADHTDTDGDLIPDDCDGCPCDPDEVDPKLDGDRDTVCGVSCGHSPSDNCLHVKNEDQANCNIDAEIATGAEILGDQCDPVPCPAGEARMETTGDSIADFGPIHIHTRSVQLEDLYVLKIRGHRESGTAFGTTTEAADYRFCNSWFDPTLVDCFVENDSIVKDDLLVQAPDAASEQPFHPWRRVKIEGLGLDDQDLDPDARDYQIQPFDADYARTWDFGADFTRWGMPRLEPGTPGNPLPLGRFWLHTETPMGTTDDQFGVHEQQGAPVPGSSLANHYLPLQPEDRFVTTWTDGNPWYPYIWIQHCPVCLGIPKPWDYRVNEVVLLASLGLPDRFGVLTRDGTLQEVTDDLGPALRASLGDASLQWSSPAEPNPLSGPGMALPLAVALSADGTAVAETIRSDGAGLFGLADREVPARATATASTSSPAPRVGFAAVYSRMASSIFLVGGEDSTTGQQRGDIWIRNLRSGQWIPVMSAYAPGRVLAATYAYSDSRLWILDERRDGGVRVRRLARVDPQTGDVDIVGAWPTAGLFDQHWLVVDRDGSVILAASSKRLRKHLLVDLVADGASVRAEGFHAGRWDLVGAPAVDMAGMWLVMRPRDRYGARVTRLSSLATTPAWSRLLECMR